MAVAPMTNVCEMPLQANTHLVVDGASAVLGGVGVVVKFSLILDGARVVLGSIPVVVELRSTEHRDGNNCEEHVSAMKPVTQGQSTNSHTPTLCCSQPPRLPLYLGISAAKRFHQVPSHLPFDTCSQQCMTRGRTHFSYVNMNTINMLRDGVAAVESATKMLLSAKRQPWKVL
jgi:hypothetical protein